MRYAIYFTPPRRHALTGAASRWLGRDAFGGETLQPAQIPGLTETQAAGLVDEPRRYGFHGTIVAPFRLNKDIAQDQLGRSVEAFCTNVTPFEMPKLEIMRIGRFFALCPVGGNDRIETLAASAVDHFNPLRAPLDETQIARRRPETLTARQQAYLHRYGYPYVKDEFRFHMTLTGPVDIGDENTVRSALRAWFEPVLAEPLSIESLSIFIEPEAGASFTVLDSYSFTAGVARRIA